MIPRADRLSHLEQTKSQDIMISPWMQRIRVYPTTQLRALRMNVFEKTAAPTPMVPFLWLHSLQSTSVLTHYSCAGGVALSDGYLPSMHEVLNPCTSYGSVFLQSEHWSIEGRGSGVQDHPQWQRKFETSLSYKRPCINDEWYRRCWWYWWWWQW